MILILLAMLLFGLTHSLFAGRGFKHWFRVRFGERAYHGLYRVVYNAVAVISLAPVMLWLVTMRSAVVWQVQGNAATLLLVIQGIGSVGLLLSLLQIDLLRFAGLRQLYAYVAGQPLPLPPEKLQTRGFYALVRHPLYLFSLMSLWAAPLMTEGGLAFCIGTTLYFVLGSIWEERRMTAAFGQAYRDYQRRVPWMIPFLRLRFSGSEFERV